MNYERKQIEGFPGYLVDSSGDVWSFWKRGPKRNWYTSPYILKYGIHKHPSGYQKPQVVLRNTEGKKTFPVSRLVAKAFLENTKDLPCVCHKDNDSFNNAVENLYWGTPKQNMSDKKKHGTQTKGETHHSSKLKEKEVEALHFLSGGTKNTTYLGALFGVSQSNISYILLGKSWKHIKL